MKNTNAIGHASHTAEMVLKNKCGSTVLYRTIWRWHFYAGLFCIPFMLTLAVSGSIYLFKPQIDAWLDQPYQNLEISGPRTGANEQINAALRAVPNARFVNYRLPENARQAVVINVSHNNQRIPVYIDPYTLEILKTTPDNERFIQIVRAFHGELLAGNTGSVLVELAGCWAIVMVITGLYLWWPRSAKGLAGVLYPRLLQGNRVFWRDLHAVIGVWISGCLLFLLISGLPWSLVWGGAFKELRQFNSAQPAQQNWVLSHHEEHAAPDSGGLAAIDLSPELLSAATALNFAPPAELAVSKERPDFWTLKSQHQNRMLRAEAWLNGHTGEALRVKSFAEGQLIDKTISVAISAHEGQLFGWPNQLLGLITTGGLITMIVSGFVLWRKRKPGGVLGAPPTLPNAAVGKTVTAIVLTLALLLPLLALSMLALLLLEWLLLRNFARLRVWLGLNAASA